MLTLPPTVRIFVSLPPADLRCSLDGLAALTREVLREDPLSGHLFGFFNRRRNRTKILLWDRSGLSVRRKTTFGVQHCSRSSCFPSSTSATEGRRYFCGGLLCLYYKRLEKGVFRLAAFEQPGRARAELEAAELALILEGIDLAHARRRPRLVPQKTS